MLLHRQQQRWLTAGATTTAAAAAAAAPRHQPCSSRRVAAAPPPTAAAANHRRRRRASLVTYAIASPTRPESPAASSSTSTSGPAPPAPAPAAAPPSNNNNRKRPLLPPLVTLDEDDDDDDGASRASTSGSTNADDDDESGLCGVFFDSRTGDFVRVMCCDYGFRSARGRLYQQGYGTIPGSMWGLAWSNFAQEYKNLRRSFREDEYARISAAAPPRGPLGRASYAAGTFVVRLFSAIDAWLERRRWFPELLPTPLPDEVTDPSSGSLKGECRAIRGQLKRLTLSNKAVWDREHAREAAGGGVETPLMVKAAYLLLCGFLDVAFDGRPIQRFWFLESVARMPYFSYITMLHLYESLGWWRAGADLRKVHFAEEWNELHHLQIMESLGGDQLWVDRFMAQHAAIIYYWVLVGLFVMSPSLAYNFSELIEAHAVDTYGEFADANEALLRSLPPPLVAAEYYLSGDRYLFDSFQTSQARAPGAARFPKCETLYDVFINIRDDEGEHVKTMAACQDGSVALDLAAWRDGDVGGGGGGGGDGGGSDGDSGDELGG